MKNNQDPEIQAIAWAEPKPTPRQWFAKWIVFLTFSIFGIYLFRFVNAPFDYTQILRKTDDTPIHREAYVLAIPDVADQAQIDAAQVLLFSLKVDPVTADLGRDVVVLAGERAPRKGLGAFKEQGAIIRYTPHPGVVSTFGMTGYEKVLYIGLDVLVEKSLSGIWEEESIAIVQSAVQGGMPDAGFVLVKPSAQISRLFYTEALSRFEQVVSFLRQEGYGWNALDPKWFNPTAEDPETQSVIHASRISDEASIDRWQEKGQRMRWYYIVKDKRRVA